MRYKIALIALFVFTNVSQVQAQDAKQQRINQAIDAAERICLVGNRYKFTADVSGSVTITKLLPGGQGKVVVDGAQGKGSQFFENEDVRRNVDYDIRECMKSQWPAVLQVIDRSSQLQDRPSQNTIKIQNAVYGSRWHPNKFCTKINYMKAQCEDHATCQFSCNNESSECKDPSRGDSSKRCIINYVCSQKPLDVIPLTFVESGAVLTMSCPN
ncbi:hypothetical protein [Methylobacterium sp. B1]|uniref:hypothetical protein n=1 Tax=Methylobacterium sp. B1 TaxID=91459 RepID=UPI0011D21824|nr:hypothetical protein [Methylobacterium sp. B1]